MLVYRFNRSIQLHIEAVERKSERDTKWGNGAISINIEKLFPDSDKLHTNGSRNSLQKPNWRNRLETKHKSSLKRNLKETNRTLNKSTIRIQSNLGCWLWRHLIQNGRVLCTTSFYDFSHQCWFKHSQKKRIEFAPIWITWFNYIIHIHILLTTRPPSRFAYARRVHTLEPSYEHSRTALYNYVVAAASHYQLCA